MQSTISNIQLKVVSFGTNLASYWTTLATRNPQKTAFSAQKTAKSRKIHVNQHQKSREPSTDGAIFDFFLSFWTTLLQ
jgi:hypothetical protein